MQELIQSLVTIGGLGYVNYLFYERISDRNFKTDMDKKFFIGAMTSINYFLYLIAQFLVNNIILAIILAVAFSFILTLLLPWLVNLSFCFTNKIRSEKSMAEQQSKKVYNLVFNINEPKTLFIFSIPDNKLISSGYASLFSGEHEELSFNLTPLYWNDPTKEILEERELINLLDKKDIEADIYINFDKKIKVICFDFLEASVGEVE